MSKRIGEALIEKGLLTQAQLAKALKAQLIFGGHLGTSLIELGYVDEQGLGQTLAELFNVEYAPLNLLGDIPPLVIDSIPKKLVEEHSVVPIRLEDRTLHVAAIDPKNLTSLDEISFASGCNIVACVVPEVRIFQAMERYYGIPRRPRYITLCHSLDDVANKEMRQAGMDLRSGQEIRDGLPPVLPEPQESPEKQTAPQDGPEDPSEATSIGSDDRKRDEKKPRSLGQETDPVRSLEETSKLLARAESKEDLAKTVLAHLSLGMARSILFKVNSTDAYLWDTNSVNLSTEAAASLTIPIMSGSIFELLLGNFCYRGPVPREARYLQLYTALQMTVPLEILLLPVYLNDRLVAILYGDGGPEGHIEASSEDLRQLTKKLSLAFSMILIKTKILAA